MQALLTAILDDDMAKVKSFLAAHPEWATALTSKAKLYETKILHWLYKGDTALHLAAAGYRVEIAQLLLSAGADPNSAANHRRGAPLHYAADGRGVHPSWNPARQVKIIELLLRAGADINAQDKNGATPLHRAVRTRTAAGVHCLLKTGADPTLRNNSGSTPFHLAVQTTGAGGSGNPLAKEEQRKIIQEFLAFGVNPAVKDGGGISVLQRAKAARIQLSGL